jgi:biopolymer transport protein ExbD
MEKFLYSPEPAKARVEIIPLIDVVFFLLATFVLFTLSLNRITSLDLTLPRPGQPGPADDTVFIQASGDGAFYWKQGSASVAEPITAAEIGPRLAEYKRSVPLPRVFVRGDDKATLAPAVFVLDEVRKAKITQVSLETRVSPTAK